MKISYRTHPILEKMEAGSLGIMPIYEDDKAFFDLNVTAFTKRWKKYLPKFRKETIRVSETFMDASLKASNKLLDLYKSDTVDFTGSFTLLYKDITVMFYQEFKSRKEDIETAMFAFSNIGTPLFFFIDNDEDFQLTWVSSIFGMEDEGEAKKFIYGKIVNAAIIQIFKVHAQIETKQLLAGKKIKDIHCNYKNETKTDVTYLDSKWFTTLVKSDAFTVRGHFRLQPKKKDGEWTKELIWINDFQKEGYTAPARKLKHDI